MNIHPIHKLLLAGVLALGLNVSRADEAPPRTETRVITFSGDLDSAEAVKVSNAKDPEQLVRFALGLSVRGRHSDAAKFFAEAAEKVTSRDNELTVSCLAAAANEHLLAGESEGFRAATAKLEAALTRFQRAGAEGSLAVILTLGELARGEETPGAQAPRKMRPLFE
jgi:hypothetical protein